MLTVEQAIIVEGKYDKIKLSSIINAVIIPTNGFQIFKNKEMLALIRHFAENKGIIILTDSDSAGFKIRSYIKGAVPNNKIVNVYIPDVFGKERRKVQYSAEGKIGVEGIDKDVIIEAFRKAGVIASDKNKEKSITKADLFELGLSGGYNSSEARKKLLDYLNLPSLLSSSSMLDILNTMVSLEELKEIMSRI